MTLYNAFSLVVCSGKVTILLIGKWCPSSTSISIRDMQENIVKFEAMKLCKMCSTDDGSILSKYVFNIF